MPGSLIHPDFDPMPYVLFGMTSISAGLLLELTTAYARRYFGSRNEPCGSTQT